MERGAGRVQGVAATGDVFHEMGLAERESLARAGRVPLVKQARAESLLAADRCVTIGWPADLETRFERFSNTELLKKANSQAMLAQLRRSEIRAIRQVIELIDRYNAGLEQEALLVQL